MMLFRGYFDSLFRREASVAKLEVRDPAVITLISVIYSTAPKTFTGDAVFVTMTSAKATTTAKATGTGISILKSSTEDDDDSSTESSSSKPSSTSTSTSTSTTAPAMTTKPTASPAVSATASPSPTAAASTGMSGGAKAGLAFGLIILFALIGGALFALWKRRQREREEHQHLDDEKAFLANGRNPDALPAHSEANRDRSGTMGTTGTSGTFDSFNEKPMPSPLVNDSASNRARFSYEDPAPQLSLRAVSQFEPSLPGDVSKSVKPAGAPSLPPNATAAVAAAGAAGIVAAGVAGAATASTSSKSLANDPNNPFGNHAEKLGSSPPQEVPLPASPPRSTGRISPAIQAADFPLPESTPGTPVAGKFPTPKPETAVAAGAAVAGAAAIAAATAAAASNKPQGAAPSPGGPGSDNVHRVHMDFMPSPNMEDELEIHAGQLVRVMYEYDDGWALCIRMDRSAQGVVPRTCLSKHPVKPRPASPSGGRPGPRGPPPGKRVPGGPPPYAQPPRPLSPASGRGSPAPYPASGRNSPGSQSMSPAPYANSPRPLTPTQGGRQRSNSNFGTHNPANRSQSPGPYGGSRLKTSEGAPSRRRSNSMSQVSGLRNEATASPSKIPAPAGQVPTRKPVPGQAV